MRLDVLLRPRSIAILGASERPSIGRALMESAVTLGYDGQLYPINPKYTEILGQPLLSEHARAAGAARRGRAVRVLHAHRRELPHRRRPGRGRRRDLRRRVRRARRGRPSTSGRAGVHVSRGGDRAVRPQLHGHPQSASPELRLHAGGARSRRPCGQRGAGIAERLDLHRHAGRRPALRLEPRHLVRQRGGRQHGAVHRGARRRSRHQGHRHVHRVDCRPRAVRGGARPGGGCREAGGGPQGRPPGAHPARDRHPHGRPRRRVRCLLGDAARPSCHRGDRSRRAHRSDRRLPGRALAYRPAARRRHRLGRSGGADPRRGHRGRARASAVVVGGPQGDRARDRPRDGRRQPARRLGKRRLRDELAARARDAGRGGRRRHRVLQRQLRRRADGARRPAARLQPPARGRCRAEQQALLPDEHAPGRHAPRAGALPAPSTASPPSAVRGRASGRSISSRAGRRRRGRRAALPRRAATVSRACSAGARAPRSTSTTPSRSSPGTGCRSSASVSCGRSATRARRRPISATRSS